MARRIRGYMAATVDGFIAAADGGVGFLDAYPPDESFQTFFAEIGTVVTGRATWDAVVRLGHADTYAGRRGFLVTTRDEPGLPLPDGFTVWRDGVDALIGTLRAGSDLPPGDVWILGGGLLQQAFLDRDALDRLELFIVPEILGEGIRLFPGGAPKALRLVSAGAVMPGIAGLVYEPRRGS